MNEKIIGAIAIAYILGWIQGLLVSLLVDKYHKVKEDRDE